MRGKEKPAEKKLLKALRDEGFWAEHIDCGVDGFPDILAAKDDIAIFIEVKDGDRGKKLKSILEPTQPIQFRALQAAGNTVALACCHGKEWVVYSTELVLEGILRDPDLTLDALGETMRGTVESVAVFFRELAEL